jgi:hypothetical protein
MTTPTEPSAAPPEATVNPITVKPPTFKPPRGVFGMLALALAMLAFGLAFLTDWSSYLNAPVPKTLVQKASDAATSTASAVSERVSRWFDSAPPASEAAGQSAEPAPIDWNKRGKAVCVLLAVSSILFASIGFVRHEPERLIATALALSGAALAYQFVLKGLIALGAGLLIAGVLARRR